MNPLQDVPADPQPDWARLLPREAFQEILFVLRGALPPPVSDDPGDEVRRDRAAMAAVAALLPVTAAEGRLAAQFVAADAWAMDCLRLAQEKRREPDIARKCRAQAMGMMREGKSALRMLLRLQAVRQKIEADEAAAERAAWAEHGAVGMMEEALFPAPAGPVAPVGRRGRPPLSAAAEGARMEGAAPVFRSVSRHAINSRETRLETKPRRGPPSARAAA
jgi:hypothetical protein